ncbi:hypothetical protein A2911_00070 [Candidatus Nomurabacteria bacterium RIFCSPLOWO2_01_FULL_40_15]|uniref:Uncharacterized protein n=1 Tax=Candidatus Nomurabacteria bacterium RIFCSPLOWO2_01_FULL_40_15 TaxID=1801772 RepID=A0A1F6X890_9BACT|nr:MAG: hypothetical protein A2911_00070 [Candidatus Nomurabacteria bacterium RIFCSPLOWO2_01_FULL_40_15]
MSTETALGLVNKPLDGFSVKTMTEVYRTDEDGRKVKATAYFFDPSVARAWIDGLADMHYHKEKHVLVLTDGFRAFLLNPEPIEITGDEHARLEIRDKALAKLTPAERAVLSL